MMDDQAARLVKDILDHLRGLEAKGSPGLAAQVLDLFLQDTSIRLTDLREGIRRRDSQAAYHAAHSMQGSAGMVGAAWLAERCRQLAAAARAESFDLCHTLATDLENAFQAIQHAAAGH